MYIVFMFIAMTFDIKSMHLMESNCLRIMLFTRRSFDENDWHAKVESERARYDY